MGKRMTLLTAGQQIGRGVIVEKRDVCTSSTPYYAQSCNTYIPLSSTKTPYQGHNIKGQTINYCLYNIILCRISWLQGYKPYFTSQGYGVHR